jgi:hypothetical protein
VNIAVKHLVFTFAPFLCGLFMPAIASGETVDYLTQIKPILSARCYACHSGLRQQSGLRLDTAALVLRGGDSGPAVIPGNSAESLLISMLTGDSGTRMPPEEEGTSLDEAQIGLVKRWIDEGAVAPDEPTPPKASEHWSYQPPVRPTVPQVTNAFWVTNPVDTFVAVQHELNGVVPVELADKPTLLRRIYFDLTGLPPTPDEMRAFLADESPGAYERVVDHLLASPQYGERWARHWMDVWRYSDWAGYEQEIRNSARHIWRWRDWIIESLNDDKGYDQMVREMLAGDEIAPTNPDVLRATGFLARNWYKFNRNTWLDNTVEHTAKAFLGVTMNCCRCHDHKYDPISQEEYYRFRAIFEPHDVRTDRVPGQADVMQDGVARVCDMKLDEPTFLFERGSELRPDKANPLSPAVPAALGGKLDVQVVALSIQARYPALRDFAIEEDLAAAARRLSDCEASLAKSQAAVAEAQSKSAEEKNQAVNAAVAAAELESKKLSTARAAQNSLKARIAAERAKYGMTPTENSELLAATAAKAERELALCQAQEQHLAAEQELLRLRTAAKLDGSASQEQLAAAEKKLAEVAAQLAATHAALGRPSSDYQPIGEVFPEKSTGRRLAFANWVTDRRNPLAARVAINHMWLHHFGTPLVDNMFDFGLRTKQPRNLALLDWLAVELMDNGWKMKHIHRLLVTSTAYRMRSDTGGAKVAANAQRDQDNLLLWRMNPRRLEAEAVRDALFYVAGTLDQTRGGPDIDCHAAADTPRRSIYFRHAYEKQMKFLEVFDAASINECYRRSESIVPLQALALANSNVSIEQSRLLAGRLSGEIPTDVERERTFILLAFEHILNRSPSADELDECMAFLESQTELLRSPDKLTSVAGGPKTQAAASTEPRQRARENLTHVLFNSNEFVTVR